MANNNINFEKLQKINFQKIMDMNDNPTYVLDSETGYYNYIGPPIQVTTENNENNEDNDFDYSSQKVSAIYVNRPSCSQNMTTSTHITVDNNRPSSSSRVTWNRANIIDLIHVYKLKKNLFGTGLVKSDEIWGEIHTLMMSYGHTMSKTQCKDKFTNLKRMYHKKCDNDRQTGAEPMDFDYFNEFQDLFANDHSSNPIAVSSSMKPNLISVQPPTPTQTVSSNDSEDELIPPKKRRTSTQGLLLQKLEELEKKREEFRKETKVFQERVLQHCEASDQQLNKLIVS